MQPDAQALLLSLSVQTWVSLVLPCRPIAVHGILHWYRSLKLISTFRRCKFKTKQNKQKEVFKQTMLNFIFTCHLYSSKYIPSYALLVPPDRDGPYFTFRDLGV